MHCDQAVAAIILVLALALACGDTETEGQPGTNDAGADASTGGSGQDAQPQVEAGVPDRSTEGGARGIDSRVQLLGDGPAPPCPDGDTLEAGHCQQQIVLPSGVDLTDPGGLGGAGGAVASACEFPVLLEFADPQDDVFGLGPSPSMVYLAVDCEWMLYVSPDQGEESWQYEDLEAPTTFRLSAALCSRLVQDGFVRIDALACGY